VSRATRVLAGVAGSEGVSPGDVPGVGEVELVLFVPRKTVQDEDGKFVRGVWVGAQERSKVKMGDVGALAFRAEVGALALVTQFGGWWSGCPWILFILKGWRRSYCFSSRGAWI
jgi:hypothetical protein